MSKFVSSVVSALVSFKNKVAANQEYRRAIRELSAYSDRELAQLGLTRSGIVSAVKYGRQEMA